VITGDFGKKSLREKKRGKKIEIFVATSFRISAMKNNGFSKEKGKRE